MNEPEVIGSVERSGRPWWQMCCGGCLVVIVIFVVFIGFLMKSYVGQGSIKVLSLPDNFPKDIVPFHLNEVQSISVLSGASKNKIVRVLYAPFQLIANVIKPDQAETKSEALETDAYIEAFSAGASRIDTVTLRWSNITATEEEIMSYYVNQFKQAQLKMEVVREDDQTQTLTGIKNGLLAEVRVSHAVSSQAIEEVTLVVSRSNI
jgi:hypothetical protein